MSKASLPVVESEIFPQRNIVHKCILCSRINQFHHDHLVRPSRNVTLAIQFKHLGYHLITSKLIQCSYKYESLVDYDKKEF